MSLPSPYSLSFFENFFRDDRLAMSQLLRLIASELYQDTLATEQVFTSGNLRALETYAHRLKTTWYHLGLQPYALLFEQVERQCRIGSLEQATSRDLKTTLPAMQAIATQFKQDFPAED